MRLSEEVREMGICSGAFTLVLDLVSLESVMAMFRCVGAEEADE